MYEVNNPRSICLWNAMISLSNAVRIKAGVVACCSVSLFLSACAVFNSSHDPFAAGLKYYLPKTLVTIEVVPLGFVVETFVAELSEAQVALANKVGVIRIQTEIAGREYSVLVKENGALAQQLVTGLHLRLLDGDGKEEQVPDPNAGYTLQYQPSALSADKVCIGVDKKSLLSFAQASVADQTGNIIISIAKLAGRLAGPAAFAIGDLEQTELAGDKLTLKIDPLSHSDRDYVQHAIDTRFPQFRGQYRFNADDAEYFLPEHGEDPGDCPEDAICYRTRAPLRLSLKNRDTGARSITYAKVVNRAVTHHIRVDRAFLVEKITLLGFTEGVLTTVKIDKDSEALAAAQLPLTVYDAVLTSALAAPGHFLGQLAPGITNEKYNEVIKAYKDSVTAAEGIRSSLAKIRAGDISEPSSSNDVIKVTCSN